MQRINVMVSDAAKEVLLAYQKEKGYPKLDDALNALLLERSEKRD